MCTQAELDRLRAAYNTVIDTGGVISTRAADGRETRWGKPNVDALRAEIRRVEDCLARLDGKRQSRIVRFRYSKGLRR